MNYNDSLTELSALITKQKQNLKELARFVWKNPEPPLQEHKACVTQTKLLSEYGFKLQSPFAGLDTAYLATCGSGEHTFCFVAEYDALPKLGHGCGHNLICTAAIAAGMALKELLEKQNLPGRIAVMGTPGEESAGGKVLMLQQNCLKNIDAVMMVHPSWRTTIDTGSTAIRRFNVAFHGKSAHAAGSPELGLNALDAALMLFNGVNAWRQQLPENARVHGIIAEGGKAPNIIPDYAQCRFFLRSTSDDTLDAMETRFHEMIKGAALMAGVKAETSPLNVPYRSRKPNSVLNNAYFQNAQICGLNPVIPARGGRGSSDFGDFSHVLPGIHPYFGISDHEIAGHSLDFAAASNSEYAIEQMLKAAATMANIGLQFLTDTDFRNQVIS